MAAHPFGGHPTLGQYLVWARQEGCTVQSGVGSDLDGRPHTLTKIETPTGRHVIIVGAQTERLVPTMVSYLNRRLGLKAPWFALPDDSD